MRSCETNKDVVLVVDDSPESLSMINDTLDSAGLTVLVALEGQQALTIASNITPDIILLDAIMPNMDGFETCRRLKANRDLAHIPVIFMTGLSDTESIVQGLEAGGVDYIQKPVNGEELVARMKVHLANARLTLSARTALDTAGQFLFATDDHGELLWATPQAYQLFTQSGADTDWLNTIFKNQIQLVLSSHFNKDKGLMLKINEQPVEIKYIGNAKNNEHLLRLVDLQKPSDSERLKDSLDLTAREAEVLLWIAKGKSNGEIGTILGVSPRTVNKHLEQIFRKISVENRTSAAVKALSVLEPV
ncbi:MAG: response regulator transcription factor [Pseudomonadales bacterium]|nr:response regulator transcription factor [Pseudomonadales bacterium]